MLKVETGNRRGLSSWGRVVFFKSLILGSVPFGLALKSASVAEVLRLWKYELIANKRRARAHLPQESPDKCKDVLRRRLQLPKVCVSGGTVVLSLRLRQTFNLPFFFSESGAAKRSKGNLPVVILLGWAGCKDRYLQKYSTIYLQEVSSELT